MTIFLLLALIRSIKRFEMTNYLNKIFKKIRRKTMIKKLTLIMILLLVNIAFSQEPKLVEKYLFYESNY